MSNDKDEIVRLQRIIDDMLEYTDKEARRLSMNFASYAIGHSVHGILRELKEIAGRED